MNDMNGLNILNDLIDYWNIKFLTKHKHISNPEPYLVFFEQHNMSIKEVKRNIYKFHRLYLDDMYFFKRLPKSIISFKKFVFTELTSKQKQSLMYKDINLDTDSILLNIAAKETFCFLRRRPEIIRQDSFPVGSMEWEIKRISELIGQSFSLFCEEYNSYLWKEYSGTEGYLKTLDRVSRRFHSFLEIVNSDVCVYKFFPNYFYILERPYSLSKIFYEFLCDTFSQKQFSLSWVGSEAFNEQFLKYLYQHEYMDCGERFSLYNRYFYRKVAKKIKRIYFGDVRDSEVFKKLALKQNKMSSVYMK